MSTDVLMLGILGGIALLAYMIAINSHGPTRLSISYLLATIILAGTVWAIVQHVNSGQDRQKAAELRRLEQENLLAEERIRSQEAALRVNREQALMAARINNLLNQGTGLATAMMNVNLRDMALELDGLVARASETKRKADQLKTDFGAIDSLDSARTHFNESMNLIREAVDQLVEAARYYVLYYRSDDSAQEEVRERVLRQKSRSAYERFQKASAITAPFAT